MKSVTTATMASTVAIVTTAAATATSKSTTALTIHKIIKKNVSFS